MDDQREILFRGANKRTDDYYQNQVFEEQVGQLRQTVGVLKQVSNEIGFELERQNRFMDSLKDNLGKSNELVSKLLSNVNKLFEATGLSPTTLTFLFAVGVVLFLWFYFKLYA